MSKFQVGDIVEAFGVRGRVDRADTSVISVTYTDPSAACIAGGNAFTPDGRLHIWHVTPSLKLIERPRKTKKVKVWVNVFKPPSFDRQAAVLSYANEQQAHDYANPGSITQEIEVEVFDESP